MRIILTDDEFERIIQAWFKEYESNFIAIYMQPSAQEQFLQSVIAPLELPDEAYRAAEHAVYTAEV